MTIFLSVRQQAVGGAVRDPVPLAATGDGTATATVLKDAALAAQVTGRDLVLGIHGFNVSYQQGLVALSRFEAALALPRSSQFVGVLWPGDFWLPVINYPFEGGPAMDSGRRLAAYCDNVLGSARSISFVTHSLGSRVALEAVKSLARPTQTLCMMAGAINNDCLSAEYAGAFTNCSNVALLASRSDWVLHLAFPPGDAIADLLDPDHAPLRAALGYAGPLPPPSSVLAPWQIPDAQDYTHGDYLPPSEQQATFPDPNGKWVQTAAFVRAALEVSARNWP